MGQNYGKIFERNFAQAEFVCRSVDKSFLASQIERKTGETMEEGHDRFCMQCSLDCRRSFRKGFCMQICFIGEKRKKAFEQVETGEICSGFCGEVFMRKQKKRFKRKKQASEII